MLGGAGLEVRLLRQRDRLSLRRRSTVVALEGRRQLALARHDVASALRPCRVQRRINARDLTNRTTTAGVGTLFEPQSEVCDQMAFERGVVGLRDRDDRLVEHPTVDRQPLAVLGLDLVRDRHVRVQIRIASARITVGECRRDEPARLDLAGTLLALASEQRLPLQQPERIGDSLVVGLLDHLSYLARRDRPQGRDRLHRRERQIEPRHCRP